MLRMRSNTPRGRADFGKSSTQYANVTTHEVTMHAIFIAFVVRRENKCVSSLVDIGIITRGMSDKMQACSEEGARFCRRCRYHMAYLKQYKNTPQLCITDFLQSHSATVCGINRSHMLRCVFFTAIYYIWQFIYTAISMHMLFGIRC